ncbi:MAG: hypothetical protein CSA95_03090 [Bacteroidetes bacterium]|nr:MAG: hypothetical protein CSA95_03090 [Bacteroidota bacterium]PIE88748.1 MAG: hypothetical protein CSA04_00310 [Bacteroidota bacterium]
MKKVMLLAALATSIVWSAFSQPQTAYSLYINEFMADNESTIADEAGEYDDWIELWNGGDTSINLEGMYLSDDPEEPSKWMIPAVTLPPGEYLLFWADKNEEQGEMHTNFKLSKGGEFIGLYDSNANGLAPIDTLSFGEQQKDISYGRVCDGSSNWKAFETPTPGEANSGVGMTDLSKAITLYPSPTQGTLFISSETPEKGQTITILSTTGQVMDRYTLHEGTRQINVESYPRGTYFVRDDITRKTRPFIKQ